MIRLDKENGQSIWVPEANISFIASGNNKLYLTLVHNSKVLEVSDTASNRAALLDKWTNDSTYLKIGSQPIVHLQNNDSPLDLTPKIICQKNE